VSEIVVVREQAVEPAVVLEAQGPAGGKGNPGAAGASAYDVAVENGFTGTEAEWLASLHGADGDSHVPDPAAQPDGKTLATLDGELVYTDPASGGASSWDDLTDKPTEFPPEAHTHTIEDVTGLGSALAAKADAASLGTAATEDASAFATAAQGALADTAVQPAGLTKTAVGLGDVDNTSDLDKPISTDVQAALSGKADTESGVPAGGSTGQVLAKASSADFDTQWVNQTGGGSSFPPTPTTVTLTDAMGDGTFEAPAQYVIYTITYSGPCRFRVYRTADGRTADADRPITTPYTGGADLVYEYVAPDATTDDGAPIHDVRAVGETDLYYSVDGDATTITMQLREA